MNQLKNAKQELKLPLKGDFLVNNKYTFEIGGKSKTNKQIQGIDDSFIVLDELEAGISNKIPLWLFGLLF